MSVIVRCRCGYTKRLPDDAVPPRRCPECDEILRVAKPEKSSSGREPAPGTKVRAKSSKTLRDQSASGARGKGVPISKIVGGGVLMTLLVVGGILWLNRGGADGGAAAPADPIDALIVRLSTTTSSIATLELSSPQLPAVAESPFSNLPECLAASTELMQVGAPAIPKLVAAIEANQTVMAAPPMVFTWGMDDQSRFEGRDMGSLTIDSVAREVTLADGSIREVTLFWEDGPYRNQEYAFRTWAGLTLARMGSPAIPAVEPLLKSANQQAVEEAARILSFIDPAYKLPPRSPEVLWRLVLAGGSAREEVLRELKSRGPLEEGTVLKELESQDFEEQNRAVEAISWFDELSPNLRARVLVVLSNRAAAAASNPGWDGGSIWPGSEHLRLAKKLQFSASELMPVLLVEIESGYFRNAEPAAETVRAAAKDPPLTNDELRRLLLAGMEKEFIRQEIFGIVKDRPAQAVPLLVELLSDPNYKARWGDLLGLLREVDASDIRSIRCAVALLDEAERPYGATSSPRGAALALLADAESLDAESIEAVRKLRDQVVADREQNPGDYGGLGINSGIDTLIDKVLEKHAPSPNDTTE
jgi:HEAT repeat protein